MSNTEREIAFLQSLAGIILAAGNDRLADAILEAIESYELDVVPAISTNGNVVSLEFPTRS